MHTDSDNPMRPVVSGWCGKIDRALKARSTFDSVAEECRKFYSGPHDFMWEAGYKGRPYKNDEGEISPPTYRMSVNKVFEFVAIVGPILYNRNPVRRASPRQQFEIPEALIVDPALASRIQQLEQMLMANPMAPPPMQLVAEYQALVQMHQQQAMQYQSMLQQQLVSGAADRARAQLMEMILNYTPNELDLATDMREAVDEALITGRGCMWTEVTQHGNGMMIGSFFDTVDNLVIDPDAEKMEDAQWIAKRCVHPVWQVERDYNLPSGSLSHKGSLESAFVQGESMGNDLQNVHRQEGRTNDLLVYWKVWSRMGMGGRMTGAPEDLKDALELLGDNCYLVVAKDVPFPLNLPNEKLSAPDEEIKKAVEWPIPFWRDNRWPMQEIDFYHRPRSVWPLSPIAPGLGELKFINWAMSFLAGHIRTSCRDFIAIAKSASEEIKNTITHGKDLTVIEVEAIQNGINNVVSFLTHPAVNKDVWAILDAVLMMFDKRVGLTDLMYGMTNRQMRTAAEANVKQENISVRPDHMAQQVEKASTELARREALAWRWMGQPQDVVHIVGPVGAQMWQALVMDSDVDKVAREMEYRIEAGSARKPNYAQMAGNMAEVLPPMLQILNGHAAATGDTTPLNNMLQLWGKAINQDLTSVMMGPRTPPMPPMPAAPPEQPKQEKPQ